MPTRDALVVDVAGKTPDVAVLLINQGEDQRLIHRFLENKGLPAADMLSDRGASLIAAHRKLSPADDPLCAGGRRVEKGQIGELSRAAQLQGIEELSQR